MKTFRLSRKAFSIQDGMPNKAPSLEREVKTKALVGAVGSGVTSLILAPIWAIIGGWTFAAICASFSILLVSLASILTAAGADKRRSEAKRAGMATLLSEVVALCRQSGGENKVRRIVSIDGEPKNFKIQCAFEDGLAILIVKDLPDIVKSINIHLESMIAFDRKSDYRSDKIKGGYVVRIKVGDIKEFAERLVSISEESNNTINFIKSKNLKY